MTVIIDRFENDFAVVELPDGRFYGLAAYTCARGGRGRCGNNIHRQRRNRKKKEKIKGLMDELWAD